MTDQHSHLDKKQRQYFPVHDLLTVEEIDNLGLTWGTYQKHLHAVYMGETRPPRKGEWYLSGAIIATYRAFEDCQNPAPIAKLVRTNTRTETIIEEY